MQPTETGRGPTSAPETDESNGRSERLSVSREAIRAWGFAQYAGHHTMLGAVLPAMQTLVHVNATLGTSMMRAAMGTSSWSDTASDWSKRWLSGMRFNALVRTIGKDLFGSARFEGEQVLLEDEVVRLSYLPPIGAPQGVALFHAGGGLPYSDRIFRMLPEANFYSRFLERGMGVYTMELRGDRHKVDLSKLDLERLIDTIQKMSDAAFEHAGRKKMILEGYCGQGMQALAYASALPQDADRKFQAVATFVSPIDGRHCSELAELVQMTPESLLKAEMAIYELLGGCVPGESLGMGLDIPLHTLFHKSPLGHFRAGFDQPDYADAGEGASLTVSQRRDLAGAWWISYENSGRFPLSVDLVRFASALFAKGISKDGAIPATYKGTALSLKSIAEGTSLKLFGFYGGRDAMVSESTANCMQNVFGERYKHVVHLHAGHISYILSPQAWNPSHPKALTPNPIDVLLAHACDRASS